MCATSGKSCLGKSPRVARLKALRNWSLGLGIGAFAISIAVVNVPGAGSSETWYKTVAVLIAAGFALTIVGALLHGLATRKYGEV
jgi:hypothetical protein